tara:strand:+ start:775 stop:1605 length:831 start_codon:yes stop_codon:yes gene_type:complete
MARSTYRTRLEALIANPALSQRDRSFATSLLGYYNRKGRLSAGRVKWVATLEDRYSPEKLAAAAEKHKTFLLRLDALSMRCEPSSWAAGFVESLINQVKGDRRLSDRQVQILKKIEAEHDDAAVAARAKWVETYKNDPTLRTDAVVVARYYKATGYFRDTATSIIEDDAFVPTYSQYNKMVKNKYAQKVLAAHHAAPKYQAGDLVQFRANAPSTARSLDGAYLKRGTAMMVVATDAEPITSAARGAKVYKLLPVGKATTLMVEERYIMKARKLKQK